MLSIYSYIYNHIYIYTFIYDIYHHSASNPATDALLSFTLHPPSNCWLCTSSCWFWASSCWLCRPPFESHRLEPKLWAVDRSWLTSPLRDVPWQRIWQRIHRTTATRQRGNAVAKNHIWSWRAEQFYAILAISQLRDVWILHIIVGVPQTPRWSQM